MQLSPIAGKKVPLTTVRRVTANERTGLRLKATFVTENRIEAAQQNVHGQSRGGERRLQTDQLLPILRDTRVGVGQMHRRQPREPAGTPSQNLGDFARTNNAMVKVSETPRSPSSNRPGPHAQADSAGAD